MIINVLWYFFIYAFLGWCTEVVYAAAKTGKFINRGFLSGPVCPIYGVGLLLVIYILEPVKNNIIYMFLGSILITSTIEFMAGFLLEKIFYQKWWNYSDMPFNIGGYICLLFSLIWGLACLLIVDRIHPMIFAIVTLIPPLVSKVLLTTLAVLLIIDLISTVKSVLKLNKKLEIIDEITLKIREASDSIGESLANGTINFVHKKEDLEKVLARRKEVLSDLQQAKKELLETTFFGQKRLLKAFPGLKSIHHKDALEKLRVHILGGFKGSKNTKKF